MKVASLYICPWSLNDPLCQSQSLTYIRGLVSSGYEFALITLENEKFAGSADDQRKQKEELAAANICWYPVTWNAGAAISDKFSGIRSVISAGIRICRKHQPRLIHSRSSLPAFMAVVLATMFRIKFLYDADSVLSEEYADTGHLSRESRGFKFLAWSERLARKRADQIVTLTDVLKTEFEGLSETRSPITVIPCCVDTELFRPDEAYRQQRRCELGLTDEKLFVYVGKVGSWYLVEETFEFFSIFRKLYPASKLLVVTPDDPEVFREIARRRKVGENDYFVRRARRVEVREWLAAADAGFSLIKQVASKRGSSPVKFAEYLSCGLPVITTDGIGDCTRIVLDGNVGIVLESINEAALMKGAAALAEMWKEDRSTISIRCREVARREFDLEKVGGDRYRRIYSRLLD